MGAGATLPVANTADEQFQNYMTGFGLGAQGLQHLITAMDAYKTLRDNEARRIGPDVENGTSSTGGEIPEQGAPAAPAAPTGTTTLPTTGAQSTLPTTGLNYTPYQPLPTPNFQPNIQAPTPTSNFQPNIQAPSPISTDPNQPRMSYMPPSMSPSQEQVQPKAPGFLSGLSNISPEVVGLGSAALALTPWGKALPIAGGLLKTGAQIAGTPIGRGGLAAVTGLGIFDLLKKAGQPQAPVNQEQGFDAWYKGIAAKQGLNPDPDDPKHFYDYRAAYAAGVRDVDKTGHFPSKFKKPGHPNQYVDGVDTITGEPAPSRVASPESEVPVKGETSLQREQRLYTKLLEKPREKWTKKDYNFYNAFNDPKAVKERVESSKQVVDLEKSIYATEKARRELYNPKPGTVDERNKATTALEQYTDFATLYPANRNRSDLPATLPDGSNFPTRAEVMDKYLASVHSNTVADFDKYLAGLMAYYRQNKGKKKKTSAFASWFSGGK